MTEEQRRSFDNLILLCPTHHTIIDRDPAQYTTDSLKQMKANHQKKYKNMPYVPPDEIVKILNISVNTDEYSVERIHNLLKLYKELYLFLQSHNYKRL
jgi:predicted restriction endonuclease